MKKTTKKWLVIILAVVIILGVTGTMLGLFINIGIDVDIASIEKVGTNVIVGNADGVQTLYKPDGNGGISSETFKVLAFTDTHFDTYKKKGSFTMKYLIANIQQEKPDLVVFVGDLVTSSSNLKRAKQVAEVMEKLEVYWVTVLGNHEGDNGRSISREKFVSVYSSYAHCLIEDGEKLTSDGERVWGNGNTQINILTSGGGVAQSLFFLDSGNRVNKNDVNTLGLDKESYDYIKTSQIKWYKERVQGLPQGTKSMLFTHIPLCEYKDAVTAAPKNDDGSFDYGKAAEDGTVAEFGLSREKVCSSDYNSGMFDAIVEHGSTQAVVAGHDHMNSFRIRYKGVWLCYNRASGYSSYNAVTRGISKKLEKGATVYNIDADGSLSFEDIINSDSEALKLYK